jgi:Putative MetA-pathway of phenol degradation
MKKTCKIILVFTLLSFHFLNAQSPWTREKGKAYVQLGFSGLFYNQIADENGDSFDLEADVADVTIQAYSEYGITNQLEVQLIVPFKTIAYQRDNSTITQSFASIGNITLGLKYKILDKNWKIAAGLQFSPRTSQYNEESALSSGFNASTALPYITAGSSSGKWYYYGNVGYGYMTNDYSDYFRLNAEVGYNVIPQGHIILALDTRNILSEEDAFKKDEKQWPSYIDRQTYNALGLKLNYEFLKDKFGLNFSAFGAFGNKNAPLAPSINLAAYVKL